MVVITVSEPDVEGPAPYAEQSQPSRLVCVCQLYVAVLAEHSREDDAGLLGLWSMGL